MGSCACNPNKDITHLSAEVNGDTHNNNQINKYMKKNHQTNESKLKILLLGIGSSGKSTLFKQIECIHGNGFRKDEIEIFKKYIRYNCVVSMIKLLKQSNILGNKCSIDLEEKENVNAIKLINDYSFDNANNNLQSVSVSLILLWNTDAIQNTFKFRHRFWLLENMNHFFNKIDVIFNNDYIPSNEDMIKTKTRTSGIVEQEYLIKNTPFHIFDVGGQRNERKKWIQLFDAVHALIFVAALSHYASVLFEDENMNSMQESLKIFNETCNLKWFDNTQIILFLNKNDIFKEKLKEKIPLNICFGDKYNGANYSDESSDPEYVNNDDKWLDFCHQESLKFIQNEYCLLLNKLKETEKDYRIYTHVTDATSQNNVEKVFNSVTSSMIHQGLQKGGL